MPRLYRQGDEPVSGYRLLRLLGRGGFGEVWQASAPDHAEVAFKILDVAERTGLRQWRALQKLKKIRHPNLLPILGLWLRDEFGDLMIEPAGRGEFDQAPAELYLALGLADKSLLDRLKECKDEGEQGIPVGELLNYLDDAARGLDHLASPKHELDAGPVSLPHGNLKPQNILIVGDAAQVGDFGLNALLGPGHASKQASLITAFTAPEVLEGQSTIPASDQYALATIYCYLRTGYLPYSRNDPDTILLEALEGRLDFTKLSAAEQEIIRQATALKPTSRYPTCLDMTRELRRAVESAGTGKVSLVIEPGSEAVPGHKLVRCLGRGAYGEVWEALAPGRVPVALKIIRDLDRAGGRGKQEFKALEIIQRVAHNNLMELRAYWLLDKQGQVIPDELRGRPGSPLPTTLIIATKLADKNLGQLLEEYIAHGEVGIPPLMLLDYLKQVAQALDYLNSPRHKLGDRLVSIQHRDVKPDNIMLAGEVAKLTDFGLAKVVELEETSAEIHQDSVGFTFHYAAPEVLRGRVTKWSDQYALAVTYHYLRTGLLPYDRVNSAYELMMQQLEGRLDLGFLPEAERRVVARATSVIPDKRFHTCTAFIESLEMAIPADGHAPLAKVPPPRSPGLPGMAGQLAGGRGASESPPVERTAAEARGTQVRPALRSEHEPQQLHEAVKELEEEPASSGRRKSTMTGIGLPDELPPPEAEIRNLEEALLASPPAGAKSPAPAPGTEETKEEGAELVKELRTPPTEEQQRRPSAWPYILATAGIVGFLLGGFAILAVVRPDLLRLAQANESTATSAPSERPSEPIPRNSAPKTDTKPIQSAVAMGTLPEPDPSPVVLPTQRGLILGQKEPTASDLAPWLASELDKLIASVQSPADFASAYEGLAAVPASAASGKLQAFRAEALLESPEPDLARATELADEAVTRGDAPAYAKYVRARVHHHAKQPARAVRLLGEAVDRDVSLQGKRKQRAEEIFNAGLKALTLEVDPKKISATSSATAADKEWLRAASRLGGANEIPARLHLLLLGHEVPTQIAALRTTTSRATLAQQPGGTAALATGLIRYAELSRDSDPDAAIAAYAEAYSLARSQPEWSGIAPVAMVRQLVQPALQLESKLPAQPTRETRARLGDLHAAKARLIWENPFDDWSATGLPPYREAATAFGTALAHTPKPDPRRAEYHTLRGLCLTRLGYDRLTDEDWKTVAADAEGAIAENSSFAGGWNLRGIVSYHQALREPDLAKRESLAREAFTAADRAIQLANRTGNTDENLFFYFNNRSATGVLLASLVSPDEKSKILDQARQDAEQATRLGQESELAWGALGNVLEAMAWSGNGVGQVSQYPEAEAAFSRQLLLRPADADGHINRGRLLAKWLLDDAGDSARASEARRDLETGLRQNNRRPDGWYWLGRLHLQQEQLPDAITAFKNVVAPEANRMVYLNQLETLLLPKHAQAYRELVDSVIPSAREQQDDSHAGLFLLRANVIRLHLPDAIRQAIEDADRAAELAVAQPVLQAAAYESAAGARLVLSSRNRQDADLVRRCRREVVDCLRKMIKVDATLPTTWSSARALATLLEADAVEATEPERKKELIQEAIEVMRVAIEKAPTEQKASLERTRRSLQEALARANAPSTPAN